MKTFILCSEKETDRLAHVANLVQEFQKIQWPVKCIEAIYPTKSLLLNTAIHDPNRVPFLQQIIQVSKQRTGTALLPAEMGCLLGHRRIWQEIVKAGKGSTEHFLVLESDSQIKDWETLTSSNALGQGEQADLFFWGAWLGHTKLLRSSRQLLTSPGAQVSAIPYCVGEPYIKTVYCTYGYSLNAHAAAYLLQQTRKVQYPVDQFKFYVAPGNIKMGAIVPEIITGGKMGSYIKQSKLNTQQRKWLLHLLDIKNSLICFFK